MKPIKIDPKIRKIVKKVSSKRARAVIDFILKHGVVTTEDLEKMGYIHPPRAVRDVRENGIPIETIRVMGDNGKLDPTDFMLLCAECNRKKDRATETGCKNTCFKSGDTKIINSCFWASPENYTHICMEPIRRADIVWKGEEVKDFDMLEKSARATKESLSEYIKRRLKDGEQ